MKILQVIFMALLTVLAASAESGDPIVNAKVPFAFEMAGKVLPAGEYEVTFSSQRSWTVVKEIDSKAAAVATVFGISSKDIAADNVKLVFNKYGDRCFLSQVWHPWMVRELPKSKQERELVTSRVIAQNPVRVVVAARVVR
mgnify:CR=1 FL=1